MSEAIHAPSGTKESVERSARYAGHASAMCLTATMSGNTQKAAAWDLEAVAWQRRSDAVIDEVPFGGLELQMLAISEHNSAYLAINPIDTVRAIRMARARGQTEA